MAASPLVGTWTLASCEHELEDGSKTFPFGREPRGRLIYTAEGRMLVVLMDSGRANAKSHELFEATDAELAAWSRGCVAYSGRWEPRGEKVVHHVDVSLFPNWVGTRQLRAVKLTGDTLVLSTRPFTVKDVVQTARLVWKREG